MTVIEDSPIHEIWLNNDQAAKFLNISTKTLKRYRDFQKIPFYKDERKVMFKKSDLIAYLNKFYYPIETGY